MKKFLDEAELDPSKALDAAGTLGHYMPDHAANIGALTATALNYFKSLKPQASQLAPLDRPLPADKSAEQAYDRQLNIAQNPLSILKHARSGTLMPQDLTTVTTLYPGLVKSIQTKANEMLIESKSKDSKMSYNQRMGLSRLLGQPLDSTMTSQSMQAIMGANKGTDPQQGAPKKTTAAAAKASEKVADLYQTPLERRAENKK